MKQIAVGVLATLGLCSVNVAGAHAETDCVFTTLGNTMVLTASCATDATLVVPNGMTLEGAGRTITARDPEGGHFLGAVIKNAGPVAHVRNLVIDTESLISACDPGAPVDSRLRGIFLESASGTVVGNTVRNIRQVNSGCQEGSGIEVRNPPYDGTHPGTRQVHITGNRVSAYQKTGILVVGDVDAEIYLNRVTGLGPVNFIAQNGIQVSAGARATLKLNHVEGNEYLPESTVSTGILLFGAAPQTEVALNHVDRCEVGVALLDTSDAAIEANKIAEASAEGISIFGSASLTENNRLIANVLRHGAVGIRVSGATAQYTLIERNRLSDHSSVALLLDTDSAYNPVEDNDASDNGDFGFLIDSDFNIVFDNRIMDTAGVGLAVWGANNSVESNKVTQSGELDIENDGANTYDGNQCDSSSGAPVDCP
jgi:parallel beta-helix repeat protein